MSNIRRARRKRVSLNCDPRYAAKSTSYYGKRRDNDSSKPKVTKKK